MSERRASRSQSSRTDRTPCACRTGGCARCCSPGAPPWASCAACAGPARGAQRQCGRAAGARPAALSSHAPIRGRAQACCWHGGDPRRDAHAASASRRRLPGDPVERKGSQREPEDPATAGRPHGWCLRLMSRCRGPCVFERITSMKSAAVGTVSIFLKLYTTMTTRPVASVLWPEWAAD